MHSEAEKPKEATAAKAEAKNVNALDTAFPREPAILYAVMELQTATQSILKPKSVFKSQQAPRLACQRFEPSQILPPFKQCFHGVPHRLNSTLAAEAQEARYAFRMTLLDADVAHANAARWESADETSNMICGEWELRVRDDAEIPEDLSNTFEHKHKHVFVNAEEEELHKHQMLEKQRAWLSRPCADQDTELKLLRVIRFVDEAALAAGTFKNGKGLPEIDAGFDARVLYVPVEVMTPKGFWELAATHNPPWLASVYQNARV